MRKFRIVKRNGKWHWSQPGCPAGWHFCLASLLALFEPPACSTAGTFEEARDGVILRQKWEEVDRHIFYSTLGGPWPK